jgi:aldehyde dehydrogenase (NAD(P)+)
MDQSLIDEKLHRLADHKAWWAQLPIKDKVQYLKEVQRGVLAQAERWVEAEAKAKGLRPDSPLVGAESWVAGPYAVVAWLTASLQTLAALDVGADPLEHVDVTTAIDGSTVARVMPIHIYEQLLFHGVTADVWMQPHVTPENLRDNTAGFYREEDPPGRVTLVLGAGNVAAIAPLDILDRMVNAGDVVVCKMNPVNEYLGPILEEAFAPLIRDGYLAFVYGGGDVGAYLTAHDTVEVVHITGSARTHDTIVYGPGEEGERRKASDDRILDKPIFSELGGVGGTIVLPGPWSDADFQYQAEHVVTQKLHNSGHNCVASQVLILPSDWDGSQRLLDEVRRQMAASEQRDAYYPGTAQNMEALRAEVPDAEVLGDGVERILVADVDPGLDHYGFRNEFFGPMMVSTSLPGDAREFLRQAVDFCNDRLYGTLSVNLIVHPSTKKELGQDFDRAIAGLRYGGIGINVWVQSGIGAVHNALMFDKPAKTVVEAPFHPFPRSARNGQLTLFPKPPWFLTNKTAASTAKLLTEFAADPSASRLPRLFASALRG